MQSEKIGEKIAQEFTFLDALRQIQGSKTTTGYLFELVEVYYILEAKNASQKLIDKIGKKSQIERNIEYAIYKKEKYKMEFLARDISREFRKSKESKENEISYE